MSDAPGPRADPSAGESRAQRWLVGVGILVLAFNLRPAAVSVGPVLEEIRLGLGMSHVMAGVLTALPVVAFGVFGALAPGLARLLGVHRVTLVGLLGVVAGLLLRATTSSVVVFLAGSILALAGMATANVLLPSLVKLHFPSRLGLVTGLYTTSMALGLTAASSLTVPVSDAFGSWRWGLAVWAALAAVAALPWLLLLRHDSTPAKATRRITLALVARTRLGWAMALLFGLQSAQAYTLFGWFAQIFRDAGVSAQTAGVLLGVLTGVGIPISLVVPIATARFADPRWLMLALIACYPVGYLGLMLAPVAGAWAWALLLGVAVSIFPVVLTLIGLRARTPEGTAALSGFTQSVGYAVAAVGPLGISVLYDVTGGWDWPLVVLTATAAVTGWLAVVAGRPSYLEDQLPAGRA